MTRHHVVLCGNPRNSETDQVHQVDDLAEKIKVASGNGHDHFAYSGATVLLDGDELPRFDWVERTKIAE